MPNETVWKAGYQSPDDPLEYVMSTDSVDRMGDIISQKGWDLKGFRLNPIALFNHSKQQIIGHWEKVRIENGRMIGRLHLAEEGTSRIVDEVRALVKQRILKAVSVGFRPKDAEWIKDEDGKETGGILFKKSELTECSLVAVPANADALSLAKSLGLTIGECAELFGDPAEPECARRSLDPKGDSALALILKKKDRKAMTISERIEATAKAIEDATAKLQQLANTIVEEEREFTAEEQKEVETLNEFCTTQAKQLDSLQKVEASIQGNLTRSTTGTGNGGTPTTPSVGFGAAPQRREAPQAPRVPAVAKKEEKPGHMLYKSAVCHFVAQARQMVVTEVQKQYYADDARVEAIVKAATTEATTTQVGWAAELVDDSMTGFLAALEPISIYAPLRALGLPLTFDKNQSIKIPREEGSAEQLAGDFVGENQPIPVKQGVFGSVTLNPFKLAVISAFTREIAQRSTPSIEAIIRRAMLRDTANTLDFRLLDGAAASPGVRPASILNGVTGQASAGDTLANIVTDLKYLLTTLTAANSFISPVLIMHPDRKLSLEMQMSASELFIFRDAVANRNLFGAALLWSTNVPADEVIVIDAAHFTAANDAPMFDISNQATLVMADGAAGAPVMPLEVSDAAGEVPPARVVSTFQQDSIAIRMLLPTAWGMTRSGVINRVTSVSW